MKECLACHRDISDKLSTCPFCGVIQAKWRPRPPRLEASTPAPPPAGEVWIPDAVRSNPMVAAEFIPITQSDGKPGVSRGVLLGVIALVVLMLSVGAYVVFMQTLKLTIPKSTPVTNDSAAGTTRSIHDPRSDFDLSVQLEGDPLGLACNEGEFVIGNRTNPWGFIRLKRSDEEEWKSEKVPVREPVYKQLVGVSTVAWNGKDYIGYCDGAYFGINDKKVFTVHDAKTLQVLKTYPAPELIGGLAWDGKGYWAGTRRNTETSGEPAYLYHLDEKFNVISKSDAPHVGCQGLAWDGTHLWWADVFSNSIYIMTTNNDQPATIHSYKTRFGYLSGVAYDGKNIWVTEYDNKQLNRLNPNLLDAWSRGDFKISTYSDFIEPGENPPSAAPAADPAAVTPLLKKLREDPNSTRATAEELTRLGAKEQAIEVLREMIKDPDQAVRMRASSTLRDLGAPINYDRYSRSLTTSSDTAEVVDTSAELKGDTLYGSWRIYFGSALFGGSASRQEGVVSMPTFAKYRITVSGGSLTQPVVKEYEASEGYNTRNDQELASRLGPGKYKIEIFIHAQYVDRDGANKVLNSSMPSLEVEK